MVLPSHLGWAEVGGSHVSHLPSTESRSFLPLVGPVSLFTGWAPPWVCLSEGAGGACISWNPPTSHPHLSCSPSCPGVGGSVYQCRNPSSRPLPRPWTLASSSTLLQGLHDFGGTKCWGTEFLLSLGHPLQALGSVSKCQRPLAEELLLFRDVVLYKACRLCFE